MWGRRHETEGEISNTNENWLKTGVERELSEVVEAEGETPVDWRWKVCIAVQPNGTCITWPDEDSGWPLWKENKNNCKNNRGICPFSRTEEVYVETMVSDRTKRIT